ncbi:PREDICTED: protein LOW PSII ACCUMULATION 1, chloroplastic-like isoform X1 [Camelina sativa]|uniref:Protein LOW PSII ACCUMULATION 1, chloroplastic-like isoform X1 n=1 Tax=Camelina sativa TaxID=90675 RepID=A0ABM0ZCT8_CAMSA|nr:PREDICTED: protein LOW PSII ACCUMULATION 1, chloroplastic-like isoform X1 [Camelina sativa]
MVVAAASLSKKKSTPSLNRHLLPRVSNPYSRVKKRRPWLTPGDSTLFYSRRNWDSHLLVFASSSPSSSPPSPNSPTDDLTAESCVNTGLDLFKRGRVFGSYRTGLYLPTSDIDIRDGLKNDEDNSDA